MVLKVADFFGGFYQFLVEVQLAKSNGQLVTNLSNGDVLTVLLHNLIRIVEVVDVLH